MATSKKQKPQAVKNGNAKKLAMSSMPGTRLGVRHPAPLSAAQASKSREYTQKDSDFLKKAKAGKAVGAVKKIMRSK